MIEIAKKIDLTLKKKIEEIFDSFKEWFDKNKIIAFVSCLITGIITHILMITSTIMSQDGLWNSMRYAKPGDWETSLGRWGIALAEKLNFYIAIPSIATVSCIIVMAIVSVFVVDLFDIKKKSHIILISMAIVVSPTFTVTMLYIYTALAYSVNFLLAVLAVWFLYRFKTKKLGYILAAMCFVLSLGIYQSYMGVTIGLCIMLEVLALLRNEKDFKKSFINLITAAIVVVIAATAYYMFTNFILSLKKLELSSYNGANETNVYTMLMGLKNTIFMTYRDFILFFTGNKIVYNKVYDRHLAYELFFLFTSIIGIIKLIKMGKCADINKKERALRIALIIFLLICLPIGLNIIDIIVINTEIYALTAAQLILMIPFSFSIIESENEMPVLKLCACLCAVFIVFTYYISDNVTYTVEKLSYNQAYSTTNRIVDRIESLPGYNRDLPVMIAGIVGNDNYPRTNELYKYSLGDIPSSTVFHFTYGGMVETWRNFIRIFFGLDFPMCDDNTYYKISQSPEFKSMGRFPAADSVQIVHGIVVVKLHDDPPLPHP